MSDSSETDEDREAILGALPEAAESWKKRLSALEKASGSGGNPGDVQSAQQENLQAAFDGANNGIRRLLRDGIDAGVDQAELLEVTGLSQQQLDRILNSG